jgi:hypothetical protein
MSPTKRKELLSVMRRLFQAMTNMANAIDDAEDFNSGVEKR